MKQTVIIITVLIVLNSLCTVEAKERFIYSKPAFQGRMIDNETKEPIEGVVVVAVYWENYSFCLNPGGCSPEIAGVRETLTDKKGEFHIKPFTTWMGPWGYTARTDFIIYKPGYASYPESMEHALKPLDLVKPEYLFSRELGTMGEVKPPALSWLAEEKNINKLEITYGIVEMPRIHSKEQRLAAIPANPSSDYRSKELQLLYKAINEERKKYGLGEVK